MEFHNVLSALNYKVVLLAKQLRGGRPCQSWVAASDSDEVTRRAGCRSSRMSLFRCSCSSVACSAHALLTNIAWRDLFAFAMVPSLLVPFVMQKTLNSFTPSCSSVPWSFLLTKENPFKSYQDFLRMPKPTELFNNPKKTPDFPRPFLLPCS